MTYGIRLCRFFDASGSAVVNGKEWTWEFSSQLGPWFLGKDGEPLAKQPGSRHHVWRAFEDWLKELKAERELMNRTPRDERIDRLLRGDFK